MGEGTCHYQKASAAAVYAAACDIRLRAGCATWAIAIAGIASKRRAAVGVKTDDFTVTKAEAKCFVSKADKGHDMRRAFCPDCSSPVFLVNTVAAHLTVLCAGSLDDPS